MRCAVRAFVPLLLISRLGIVVFFFQAEDGIRDWSVTGVQTCALPILACLPALGKDEVQKRGLQRSQGAPGGRHRTRHRPRRDRGGDQRPAAQLEARVPQCLDKNGEGLEIHRVAVDAAARHIAMGWRDHHAARPRPRGDPMRRREVISLFGGMAAAWSRAAHAQESATMQATEATTATLPQIEMARVKPVDTMPPNLRLSDNLIDLMEDFSLSSAQGIGAAWGIPLRASTPFDERY